MKDFLGTPVSVGDRVVVQRPNSRRGGHFTVGVVEKLNPKTATVRYPHGKRGGTVSCFAPSEKLLKVPYKNTPTVVCVIVPLGGGGVLAVRRANEPGKGKLGLPGGYQMAGETWQMAGIREVAEETGFILYPEELEMVSMATDEYGNNLVIAGYTGTSTDYVVSKETDGEATELVRANKETPEDEWAFPRHRDAVGDYFIGS